MATTTTQTLDTNSTVESISTSSTIDGLAVDNFKMKRKVNESTLKNVHPVTNLGAVYQTQKRKYITLDTGENGDIGVNKENGLLRLNELGEIPSSRYGKPSLTQYGGLKVGFSTNAANRLYKVQVDSNGNAFVNVPWVDTNTTYPVASSIANGLMTSAQYDKLYALPTKAELVNDYALKAELNNYALKSDISALFKFKDTRTFASLMALTSANKGDVYNISDKNASSRDGVNYVCIKTFTNITINSTNFSTYWDALGTTIDLSNYATKLYVTNTIGNSLDGYYSKGDAESKFVAKVNGKGLSTNDYTTGEKNKLAGIADNANNYVLPLAQNTVRGGIKVGYDSASSNEIALEVDLNERAFVRIPTIDASSDAEAGLMAKSTFNTIRGNTTNISTAFQNINTLTTAVQALASSKSTIYYDSTQPEALATNDIWFELL